MEWLQAYAWLVSIILSFFTLLVWVFYAFLLHRDAKQQRLPALFIHQAHGQDGASVCLLSNLGREIVHVLGVMAVLRTKDGSYYKRVESREVIDIETGEHSRIQDIIKQGPLPSGFFLSIGSFGTLLEPLEEDVLSNHWPHPAAKDVVQLEIRVAAIHAAHDDPIGALRRFEVEEREGRIRIHPSMPLTKVLLNRRDRRTVRRWIEQWIFRNEAAEA